jgi:hypothetical protein
MGAKLQIWFKHLWWASLLLLASCNLDTPNPSPLPNVVIPSQTAIPAPSNILYGDLTDESAVMAGICFEGAFDARGKIFLLKTALDHINFYDQADNARLCRRNVARMPFDFDNGAVLVGIWSYGRGCTSQHTITAYERDEEAKTITIRASFATQGDCNYELLQPLWIGVPNAQAYGVTLVVE